MNTKIAGFTVGFVTKVGIAAIVFILFAKWLTAKVNIPGLTNAIHAV